MNGAILTCAYVLMALCYYYYPRNAGDGEGEKEHVIRDFVDPYLLFILIYIYIYKYAHMQHIF